MHIILDSNIFLADIRMSGISFQNLFTLVRRTQSTLVLPHLVREEVVARYQDTLKNSINAVQKAWTPLRNLVLDDQLRKFVEPEVRHQTRALRKMLKKPVRGIEIVNLTEMDGVEIREVYLRAINRKRPSNDKGEELRDVILWLFTLAYAKRNDCPVVFVSGDSAFHDGGVVASEILEDIKREQVDVRVFRSIKALVTDESPKPASIDAEHAQEMLNPEILSQSIISAARYAANLRFGGPWPTTKYGRGDMDLVSIRFLSGSLYVVEPDIDFAEITYEVELSWNEVHDFLALNQQDALAALSGGYQPSGYRHTNPFFQSVATPSPPFVAVGIPGFMSAVPLEKTETYVERERISSEVLVFARIEKNKLKSFEVHEVTIKSIEHRSPQGSG